MSWPRAAQASNWGPRPNPSDPRSLAAYSPSPHTPPCSLLLSQLLRFHSGVSERLYLCLVWSLLLQGCFSGHVVRLPSVPWEVRAVVTCPDNGNGWNGNPFWADLCSQHSWNLSQSFPTVPTEAPVRWVLVLTALVPRGRAMLTGTEPQGQCQALTGCSRHFTVSSPHPLG